MRWDNGVTAKELQLERSLNKTAIDRNNSELENLSMALQQAIDENSNLKSKLREIGGGDKNAIATLQTELDKIKGELEEREVAIAKLKTELTAGEVKQLTLFPDQELTPTPEPEPDTTGTLTRGELIKYIHANFPGATITGQNIGDCYTLNKKGKLKSSRMPEFEATYGFKYLGKIGNENRFRLV